MLSRRNLAYFAALTAGIAGAQPTDDRPDIILFMVDDMGWQDTSLPFAADTTDYNRMFRTPNMERLAAKGMKFTQAYACAISSPSRCSLITGANNARHRVTNWTLQRDTPTDDAIEGVKLPEWNWNGVAQSGDVNNTYIGRSFVDLLRQSGYHTIHVGKAHFGAIDTPGENPAHMGFETNIAGHAGGGLATYLSENNFGHRPDGSAYSLLAIPGLEKYWGSGTFATEALTREALKEIDRAIAYRQPYFLYMSHYAVHIPIDRDPRFYDDYISRGFSPKEAAYASLVEGMDKSLGDILDKIDSAGRSDRTIIIFMSDNGGLASQPEWRDGEIYTQNSPLRSGKGSLLEGGIREPMIVSWPGVTEPASTCGDYIMIEDFYPTILEMAGVDFTPDRDKPVDGISFVPLLKGQPAEDPEREIIWNFPNIWGNEGPGINLNTAIRRGPYKLIYDYVSGQKQLYNIIDDISETNNLATQMPDLTDFMSQRLGERLREMDAQRPFDAVTGKPFPWPDEIN